MRLINTDTLDLSEFFGSDIPKYAILSHTWDKNGEITYQEWVARDKTSITHKSGYQKVIGACQKAYSHGIDWLWVDTNCIDKTSSAELSEAINSMFTWYHDSVECYVYLADVEISEDIEVRSDPSFRQSKWFTRGWTLQELLAPKDVTFYACDWSNIGNRDRSLLQTISEVTGIGNQALCSIKIMSEASVATKMSWLSRRETTRVEDMAYCMLGIFNLNMPLLYGEGSKAFTRLQEEIIKKSNDHSIFAWSWNGEVPPDWTSVLAPSPSTFEWAAHLIPLSVPRISFYSITNFGLSIELALTFSNKATWVSLDVTTDKKGENKRAYIPVEKVHQLSNIYRRPCEPSEPLLLPESPISQRVNLCIDSHPGRLIRETHDRIDYNPTEPSAVISSYNFGILLLFPPLEDNRPSIFGAIPRCARLTSGVVGFDAAKPDSRLSEREFGSSFFRRIPWARQRSGKVWATNSERDDGTRSLLLEVAHAAIYIVVKPASHKRGITSTLNVWYVKTWKVTSRDISLEERHFDKVKRDIQRAIDQRLDSKLARELYGIHIDVGEKADLGARKDGRVIFMGQDLRPILSGEDKLDATPRYSMSVGGSDSGGFVID